MRQLSDLHPRGVRLNMSVNISSRQLMQNNFLEIVCSALDKNEFPANALKLELTEKSLP